MPPISIKAIAIAFSAEVGADFIISFIVFYLFGHALMTPEMSQAEFEKVQQAVFDTTAYLPCMFVLGTATTVLGGYLAARLARRIPYYHGLAMGVVGLAFSLALWRQDMIWLDYVGLVITIPASIFGAHVARKHLPTET